MIDIQYTTKRGSGQTTELVNLYYKNPGIYYTTHSAFISAVSNKKINVSQYAWKGFYSGVKYEYVYMDNFFDQNLLTYDQILYYEKNGSNIYIRGFINTGYIYPPYPPKWFMNYCYKNYPENFI